MINDACKLKPITHSRGGFYEESFSDFNSAIVEFHEEQDKPRRNISEIEIDHF